jgi:hypothetical protein
VRDSLFPVYAIDRLLTAVATDETDTYVMFQVSGMAWSATLGDVCLRHAAGMACIATTRHAWFSRRLQWHEHPVLYAGLSTGTGDGDIFR